MRWEDKLSFRTIIKQSHKLHIKDFIFFDIIPTHISNSKISKRFSYSYINSDNILGGLQEFYNVTKFITSDKPSKKQKRNDYED